VKILLTHSPMDDPTIPYHSNAYLAGHLVHSGFDDVTLRDTNAEFFNWCLEEEVFARFSERAARRFRELSGRTALSFAEQEEYLGYWSQPPVAYERVKRARETLRTRDRFFDFEVYKESVQAIQEYFGILGALSYPCDLGNFRQASRGRFSQCHLRDLFDPELGARICQPFCDFMEERMAADAGFQEADCIGISIVYEHQIYHAIQFARWLKRQWPEKAVVFGGTAISQLYKYLKDRDEMKRFFSFVDGVVAGEGETALCQIADAGEVVPGMPVQNLITYDAARDRVHLPQHIHYENVPALGRPRFEHPWDLYLSPERGINYSPTRGCYWNKCTFCDYGLNTATPTSPWRERRVEQVIDDLRHAVDDCGARFVYFAVDVMSPAYLDRLSDALLDAGLGLRWGAEIRMERVFTPERCRKMAASGCVHVSFGMESGNQRVLDLIDKGTKIEYMGQTMKNFTEAGVAVHLFTFTGFPTETREEKEESKRFIREHEAWWSGGGMGTFLLTGTAIVARDPARFGVRLVDTKDADVARSLAFELEEDREDEDRLTSVSSEESDISFDHDGGVFPGVLGRPWAGSTDCLHTMIYYEIYDRSFFRIHTIECVKSRGPESDEEFLQCSIKIPGVIRESPFDIGHIVDERREFVVFLRDLLRVPEEPTLAKYEAWGATREPLARMADGPTYWIRSGPRVVQLDKLVYRLLTVGAESKLPIGKLLSTLPESLQRRLIAYIRQLGQDALLRFTPPRPAEEKPMPLRQVALPSRRVDVVSPLSSLPPEPPHPQRLPSLPVVA
jgi:anaerobic magnesium-protoporphyrin IX monomethyl ester cyclase